ncbi:hypothetical protein [Streptomyces zaomyceticus]|uniref:hypothetical protein n=1 Tax=Streptomyces zaomyceticus TaxID=68286 RepID=UPI00167AF326|nr:hypothetical protein [Streptomyces zaomyceticus]GHG34054.1 hypothetical protein GCM10018791_59140 [Streptomyces zaomyceticus]
MTTTPLDPTDAPDPYAPSRRALRVVAGCGFLLLAACFVATVMVVLRDAVEGDGAARGFVTAAFWTLFLGALSGVAALIAPRKGLVIAEYALAIVAPVVALMD